MRRSKAVDGNPVITHIWNGSEIVAEVGGAIPTIQNTYVYGLDRIMTGEGEYFTYNSHGDTTGFGGDEYDYDAFGNQIDENADATYNPFRYCGEYFDEETGFVYLRARYYDPSTQRFVTEDPAFDGYNWYGYCYNNPCNYIDITGKSPKEITRYVAHVLIANPLMNYVTENGLYSDLFYIAGFVRDDGGVYHARQDAVQQVGGYNDCYDVIFNYATSMRSAKFEFAVGDRNFILWAWKGDYLNLGAGAEIGIYSDQSGINGEYDVTCPIDGHWLVDTSLAMPMTLQLFDGRGNEIVNYSPSEKQWWITGFNPKYKNVEANRLSATYTIDFSQNKEMFNALKKKIESMENEKRWFFDTDTYIAKFVFGLSGD